MQILRNGPDIDETCMFCCANCKSLFLANKNEYQKVGLHIKVNCPICNQEVTI